MMTKPISITASLSTTITSVLSSLAVDRHWTQFWETKLKQPGDTPHLLCKLLSLLLPSWEVVRCLHTIQRNWWKGKDTSYTWVNLVTELTNQLLAGLCLWRLLEVGSQQIIYPFTPISAFSEMKVITVPLSEGTISTTCEMENFLLNQ